jgi:hypothetical protein
LKCKYCDSPDVIKKGGELLKFVEYIIIYPALVIRKPEKTRVFYII